MSKRELTRLEVMQRLKDICLRQCEAACILGISTRQIKRLFRAYKDQGQPGLISRRHGRPNNNRLDAPVEQKAIDLIY